MNNLEKKVWYRIAKVSYGVGWIIVVLLTLSTFITTKPTSKIDTNKSSFACPNQTSYRTNTFSDYYSKESKYLNKEDNKKALAACELGAFGQYKISSFKEQARKQGFSEAEIAIFIIRKQNEEADQVQYNPPYTLNFVGQDEDIDNWVKSLAWTVAVFFVGAFILDLIKNVVLYIITGKKFSHFDCFK